MGLALANLGTLTLDLVAKIGGFTGPLDQAGRESKKFQKSVTDGFNRMGAAVGAAALAAASGIALFVKQSIDAADEASKAAQATGLTVEAFSGLSYAAKLADLDTEKFKGGMNKLNKTLGEASTGGKEQASVFQALGISIKNASGDLKSGDEVLKDIAERFKAMPDGVDKSATAMKLFGKSGADMIPLLNAGRDGIQAMITEAEALGVVMTTTQAQASEQFNDSLTTLGQVTRGAANEVAKELLPALNSLTGMMITVAKDTGTASEFGRTLAGVLKFVASAAMVAGSGIMMVGRQIGAAGAAASFVLSGEFGKAANVMRTVSADQLAVVKSTGDRLKKLWGSDYEAAGKKAASVVNVLGRAHEIAGAKAEKASGKAAAAAKKEAAELERKVKAINDEVKALQLQAETLGWSDENKKLHDLALKGATASQIEAAEAALKTVAAFEAEKKAQEDVIAASKEYSDLVNDLMTDDERYTEQLKKRLAVMDAINIAPNADMAKKIVSSGVTKAPTFGRDSNPFGEVNTAAAELEAWYAKETERQELIQELSDKETEIFRAAQEQKQKIYEEYAAKKDAIDRAREKTAQDLRLTSANSELALYESITGSMGEIAKNFAGESSMAYKAMFALQKIFAAAMIIANTEIAASKAGAELGIFGLPLAAVIRATGYANAGMVAGMGLAGMAHDGIDSVPETGSWLLKKGERVTTSETSAKLDRTLENVSRQSNSGGEPIVNLYEDKSKAGQVESRQQDDRRVIDIWVADLMGDGKAQKAMSRKFGLQPVGV